MFGLALHYLFARRRQTFLMLLGVCFGTASFITLSGLLIGFKEYLVDQLVNNAASVHIEPRDEGGVVAESGAWMRALSSDARVAGASPLLTRPAIFTLSKKAVPSVVVGCDPALQARVTTIASYVALGGFAPLERGGGLVLGWELRKKLGASLGQKVRISTAGGPGAELKVVGIVRTGVEQGDNVAYAKLGDVQRASGAGKDINEIAVRLVDYTKAAELAETWNGMRGAKAESWDQKNPNFVDTFKAEDLVRFLSIGAVLLVAGFGIYNVLSMTVVQKRKDIAILRSMGYGAGDVVALFLYQGLLLGAAGVALGGLAGFGLSLYLRTVAIGGNPMGSGTGHLAISMDAAIYAQAAVLGLLATGLSTLAPAYAAGKLDPIEIIRAGAE